MSTTKRVFFKIEEAAGVTAEMDLAVDWPPADGGFAIGLKRHTARC